MKTYLSHYLDQINERGSTALSSAIKKTVDDIVPKYIANFSFSEHVVSLLVGDVQSGKTSHMFGLICAAADAGFACFILLTTDNILLQKQTYDRAKRDLGGFCICGENDYIKFIENKLKKPVVVVLKKNQQVLKKWKGNLASTRFVAGNPLFIIDDEADAASLNTLVNKSKQSTINKCLDDIKKTTSSSIYLEVTGTPQSILLQSNQSGWKPWFIYYFMPGEGYMGGDFFFNNGITQHVILTDNDEASELLSDDEFPENGLKTAVIMHLITAAHIKIKGGSVCNFLVHPSVKTTEHQRFAEKIGNYLNELNQAFLERETKSFLKQVYDSLKETKTDIEDFDAIYATIAEEMANDKINICVLNSTAPFIDSSKYNVGNNILIGGNSLGRGVTFSQLQTIYYCRSAKNPQADTMWQHARMFGYDRDPLLMRVFMPPMLFKLFSDINSTNNQIVAQIKSGENGNNIKICYPSGIKPTRKNVIDKRKVEIYSGGVNYFPFYPTNKDIDALDVLLARFEDGIHQVSLKFISKILEFVGSESEDWNASTFQGFVNTYIATDSLAQGTLILRRNRNIGRGTGTLLSPNDRTIGDKITDSVVLTLYKITGEKGWDNQQLWIPNIKLPGDFTYYSGEV